MGNIEEAEILENGGIVVRYYYGKTILIPGKVVKKEGIPVTRANEIIKTHSEMERKWVHKQGLKDGSF